MNKQNVIAKLVSCSKLFLAEFIKPGSVVCDATIGNGHDSLFLLSMCGPQGKLIGFDIQPEAIHNATKRVTEAGYSNFSFYLQDHAKMDQYLEKADAIVFNLGYLPGHEKNVVTYPESTLQAVKIALGLLTKNGILSIMFYVGHPGGREEADRVMGFLRKLNKKHYDLLEIKHGNRSEDSPFLAMVTKKEQE